MTLPRRRAPRVWVSLLVAVGLAAPGLLGCQGTDDRDDGPNTGQGGTDQVAPLGRLRVSDGKLLDAEGDPIVLQGLGLGTLDSAKAMGRYNEDYFAHARDWGAELVRLPVSPKAFRAEEEQTLRDLDDAVTWCRKHGLYLIIDYHVTGNATQGLFQFEESTTWKDTEHFWKVVAPRYADVPVVAFAEVFNEPAAITEQGGSLGFDEWREHADALVAIVRKSAPEMIPLVAGLDFAYDFSPGGDKPFADPDIALSVHPYPGQAREHRTEDWDAAFGYLSEHYPIVLTELGFDPYDRIYPPTYLDDLSYGRQILGYAQDKQISWTAFVFFNATDWPMPLFSDWKTLAPTVSGLFFKDALAGKDLETAGDGFGKRPEVEYPEANGPSDMHWLSWANQGASVAWTEQPNANGVGVHIETEGSAQAGMFATFFWDSTTLDASEFNEMVIEGTVAEGDRFSVVLGRNAGHAEPVFHGCSWDLMGNGEDTYTVDLLSPDWCGPETCYDMQASGIGFNNSWTTDGTVVDVLVRSVELRKSPDEPLAESGVIGTGACP